MCPTDKEGSSEPPAYAPFHQGFLLLQTLYETASILHSNVCHFVNLISATIFDGDFYYHFVQLQFNCTLFDVMVSFTDLRRFPLSLEDTYQTSQDWAVDELIIT